MDLQPLSALPACFKQDFLGHRHALRTQRAALPTTGSQAEQWKRAQAWSHWYALLGNKSTPGPVARVQESVRDILDCDQATHQSWDPDAPSPQACWLHPVAEAMVRLEDGNGVDSTWLRPLLALAQQADPATRWVQMVGTSNHYDVNVQTLATLAIHSHLDAWGTQPHEGTARDLEESPDPWEWCRDAVTQTPELSKYVDFWQPYASDALDVVLGRTDTQERRAMTATLITFFFDLGACPSPEAMTHFHKALGRQGSGILPNSIREILEPWIEPLEARVRAAQLDQQWPGTKPAVGPRF